MDCGWAVVELRLDSGWVVVGFGVVLGVGCVVGGQWLGCGWVVVGFGVVLDVG